MSDLIGTGGGKKHLHGLSKGAKELVSGELGVQSHWQFPLEATIKDDSYRGKSLKRSRAYRTRFENCDFSEVAATGSSWRESSFFGNDFSRTNFDWCTFDDSKFLKPDKNRPNQFVGASFVGASFRRCRFDQGHFRGTNLSQADFSEASLDDLDIQSCTLEGAQFNKAALKSLRLNQINIEFCDFSGATFDEVSVALFQFPYIFGIRPEEFESQKLSVSTSNTKLFPKGRIPWEVLLSRVDQLVEVYENVQDYFPIANLYLASGQRDKFQEYLQAGFRLAVQQRNFRYLKYLSQLANLSGQFSELDKLTLYQSIGRVLRSSSDQIEARRQFAAHEGVIRQHLLKPASSGQILVEALIGPGDSSSQALLGEMLERIDYLFKQANIPAQINQIETERYNPFWIKLAISFNYQKTTTIHQHNPAPPRRAWQYISQALVVLGVFFGGVSAFPEIKQALPSLNSEQVETMEQPSVKAYQEFCREGRSLLSSRIEVNGNLFLSYQVDQKIRINQLDDSQLMPKQITP